MKFLITHSHTPLEAPDSQNEWSVPGYLKKKEFIPQIRQFHRIDKKKIIYSIQQGFFGLDFLKFSASL